MTIIAPQPLRSFENYLTLSDAVELIGKALDTGWQKSDSKSLSIERPLHAQAAVVTRSEIASERLRLWLVGQQLIVYSSDYEGVRRRIPSGRLSSPYFQINIPKSLFAWSPEDWAPIFVDFKSLQQQLKSIDRDTPRRTPKLKWQDITNIAWKKALDMDLPRQRSILIASVQAQCMIKFDKEPGDKELGAVVDEIIEHLDGKVLSREV